MPARSQNNYTANDRSLTESWKIPGTDRAIRLRKGAPGALLVHLAAWFHANIESIDSGQLDDWGYAERPVRGQDVEYDDDGNAINLSNHASGTAEDLNALRHPLGVRNTFTRAQAAAIRAQLKIYEGCIRWGGDYVRRADEMHFEIVKSPAECERVLRKLTRPEPPATHEEENPLSGLTDADAAKIGGAVADALVPKLDKIEQKYTVADNNYDSQRAAYEAVAQAEAARILAGNAPSSPDLLNKAKDAVWSFLRSLWSAQ
jgi:hypothetical protein